MSGKKLSITIENSSSFPFPRVQVTINGKCRTKLGNESAKFSLPGGLKGTALIRAFSEAAATGAGVPVKEGTFQFPVF
jgi:hypothetical protein